MTKDFLCKDCEVSYHDNDPKYTQLAHRGLKALIRDYLTGFGQTVCPPFYSDLARENGVHLVDVENVCETMDCAREGVKVTGAGTDDSFRSRHFLKLQRMGTFKIGEYEGPVLLCSAGYDGLGRASNTVGVLEISGQLSFVFLESL